MAVEYSQVRITLPAGADLSAASNQFKFVSINGSAQAVVCSAATDRPIGVLQNTPASGGEAIVCVSGGTKIVASAAIDEGVIIGTDATGKADAKTPGTDTTEYVVGTVILASGADGDLLTAMVDCAAPHRAS